MKYRLQGVLPAILTPFTRGGKSVDYDKALALAGRFAKQGTQGIFVCGTTGEGLLLSMEERKKLVEEHVGNRAKGFKVIPQTGCQDTQSTIALTRHARDAGADAVGVYTPGIYAYDDAALYAHYKAVAKAVPDFPVLLYNIPRSTGNHLSPKLVARLANEVDNIVGMKDSSGDLKQIVGVIAAAPKDFVVINGACDYTMQAYVTGCAGSVSLNANVVPEIFLAIFDAVKKKNIDRAHREQRKLTGAIAALGSGTLLARYKEALRLRGFDAGYMRPPQRELTRAEKKALAKNLEREGLL